MRLAAARLLASPGGLIATGALFGAVGALLHFLGNPPNMGLCVACFERDLAGALGLHRAAAVQYMRPEIPGILLGAWAAALLGGEFRARSGSMGAVRFLLGLLAAWGSLAFLGCSWRMLYRLAGGDGNGLTGLAGLATGVLLASGLVRAGFSLGRSRPEPALAGLLAPGLAAALLALLFLAPSLLQKSAQGVGALHARPSLSLTAGLLIGALAQQSRFCTVGAFQNFFLARSTALLKGLLALVAAAFAVNLLLGQVRLGLSGQPIAHADHLWNFLGMLLAGLAFALGGGCPGRQLVLAGEGDGSAALFVMGLVAGGGLAHNFGLAGVPDGPAGPGGLGPAGKVVVLAGIGACLLLGLALRDRSTRS